jgi:heavy metal translocating P-type ATPase
MTRRLLAFGALLALVGGGLLHLVGSGAAGDVLWAVSVGVMLVPLGWSVLRSLLRRDVGVDAIALVSMAGALGLRQFLAGAVIGLMLAGGNALEEVAGKRARRELTKLVERAPRTAHLRRGDAVEEVPVGRVAIGDVVVVRAGEVVPADGIVVGPGAVVDESALTGEPLPATYGRGEQIRSGVANAGDVFELRVVRPAADSAYAALVRLVREAETQRAPFVRIADRYALVFLPVTAAVAGLAWGLSGDVIRALAVFVVATPCPLILAAPIALLSGVSRAASAGVIVKGGGVIEKLGRVRTVLLDKTGTLTLGTAEVERVVRFDGIDEDELLRLAASLDQLSLHALAEAIVHGAERRGQALSFPEHVEERPGKGIEGLVDGRRVAVGSAGWLRERGYDGAAASLPGLDDGDDAGRSRVLVGIDGRLAGAIVLADRPRDDAGDLVAALRHVGIRHVAMVTGDRQAVAEQVGARLGIDRVYAEHSPEQKLEVVRAMQENPELAPVMMVGDGINDAPALALADVGIAMGIAGATIASETADAVIVVDRVDRVADAVSIGRRSLQIAVQSVAAGLGLSLIAMGFAAYGLLPPTFGALLQEAIDVAVILNALRALREGKNPTSPTTGRSWPIPSSTHPTPARGNFRGSVLASSVALGRAGTSRFCHGLRHVLWRRQRG